MDYCTPEEQTQVIREVCRRAAVDRDFRALALTNPAAAIAKVTTKVIPPGITFCFVDNSGPTKTIPLPHALPETDELTDGEIERIAGGNWTGP